MIINSNKCKIDIVIDINDKIYVDIDIHVYFINMHMNIDNKFYK